MADLPLRNVRITEVSTEEPAAFCACHLGDLGAEVIRIELPTKIPNYPKQVWEAANRNKKSISLNPESPHDRKILENVILSSDVFLEDQAPGDLDKLGMGYQRIQAINPAMIYCSISSYGQNGPYRDFPGDEICAQAIGGMLMLEGNTLGNIANPKGGKPCTPDVMVAETKAALHAEVGILSALIARKKNGRGQYLEVSLLDGVVSQKALRPMVNVSEEATGFQIYETKDNKYIVTAAVEPWTWKNLVEKLGRSDLIGIAHRSKRERADAIETLRKIFRSKTREEWLELFKDVDTEVSPAYSCEEAALDPHVRAREMIVEVRCSDGMKRSQYSIPMRFSKTPGKIRHPAPRIGENTKRIISKFQREDSGDNETV